MKQLLLVLLFVVARSEDIEVDDPDVFVLTTDNFSDFINNNDYVLVEFYAPWCGYDPFLRPLTGSVTAATLHLSTPKLPQTSS